MHPTIESYIMPIPTQNEISSWTDLRLKIAWAAMQNLHEENRNLILEDLLYSELTRRGFYAFTACTKGPRKKVGMDTLGG